MGGTTTKAGIAGAVSAHGDAATQVQACVLTNGVTGTRVGQQVGVEDFQRFLILVRD